MLVFLTRGLSLALLLAAVTGIGCGGDSPRAPTATPQAESPAPRAPIVPQTKLADWCGEHGVPESVCTRCNAELTAGFKATGDWCDVHTMPKSQCVTCDPSVEAKWKAMAPKK